MNNKGFVSTGIVLALLVLFVTIFIVFINSFNVGSRLVALQINDIKENFNYHYDYNDNLYNVLKNKESFFLEEGFYVTNSDVLYYVYLDNQLKIIDKFDSDYVYFSNGEKVDSNIQVSGNGTYDNPFIEMEGNNE